MKLTAEDLLGFKVIDEIIKQLEIEYKINRVQNKNNQLILVY